MKYFTRYISPGLFGLLIYATIRILNDTVSGFKFWQRPWPISAIEILFCLASGYLLFFVFDRLFRYFDKDLAKSVGYKTVLRELLWVCIATEVCTNLLITPMVALTDDGLSWGDVAAINIIPLLYCMLYYAIVRSNKLLQAYVLNKMLLEKISNDQLQTELKFLKAQYHPHFLFNALNTVYFQMDEDVQAAKKSIEQFSELLRYQLYDQRQQVPVSQEIAYLKNFIGLQQVRSSERLQLQVEFDATLNGQQVYPLLFLPLVENAFKYVGGEYRLYIGASANEKEITFRVENSLPEACDTVMKANKGNGIGLENLRRRLALLYPGKHRLVTEKRDNTFFAAMHLTLQ